MRVVYDATKLSYDDILQHFIEQGGLSFSPAYSRQYRSALLVHSAEQRAKAESLLQRLETAKGRSLYVDIEDATDFYRAEEYHQKWQEKQMGRRY